MLNTLEVRRMSNRWIRVLLPALALVACKPAPAPQQPAPAPQQLVGGALVVEVAVTSKGFEPSRVEVAGGRPLILRITRKVAVTCADAIDVQGDPVRHMLPLDRAVDVRVTAPPSGELVFACPMNMYRGALVVAGP